MSGERATWPAHSRPFGAHCGPYCPLHEYDQTECDEWCAPRRDEMRALDVLLRRYWRYAGYGFVDRGRAAYRSGWRRL